MTHKKALKLLHELGLLSAATCTVVPQQLHVVWIQIVDKIQEPHFLQKLHSYGEKGRGVHVSKVVSVVFLGLLTHLLDAILDDAFDNEFLAKTWRYGSKNFT